MIVSTRVVWAGILSFNFRRVCPLVTTLLGVITTDNVLMMVDTVVRPILDFEHH